MKQHYTTLGLQEGASQEEIEGAYKRLSKELNPANNDNQEFFKEEYKKLQQAYKALSASSILATKGGAKKTPQKETTSKETTLDKNTSKSKAKKLFSVYKKPLLISVLLVVLLKLFFSDKLQNISINYFKINFNEVLIISSLFIFYTLFSIYTFRKKVSKSKLIAREILFIFFNIIVGFSFYISFQYLSNKNLEHNNNKETFLNEISMQNGDVLNNKQVSSAKELGYIVETNKAYFSKWYEILQYKSLTSINGIYKFKKNKIDTIKKEQPEIYNSFIDFFGKLNDISSAYLLDKNMDDELGFGLIKLNSEKQYFYIKPKRYDTIVLATKSKNPIIKAVTFDLTLGKYRFGWDGKLNDLKDVPGTLANLRNWVVTLDYTKTKKEYLLDLPIVFKPEELSFVKSHFALISEYGFSNLYTERVKSTLLTGHDDDTFYNKKTLFYKYSFFRHLDTYSLIVFEAIFKNSLAYNLFWGIFLLIFILAYIYRILLIGFIWSITKFTN